MNPNPLLTINTRPMSEFRHSSSDSIQRTQAIVGQLRHWNLPNSNEKSTRKFLVESLHLWDDARDAEKHTSVMMEKPGFFTLGSLLNRTMVKRPHTLCLPSCDRKLSMSKVPST